MSNTRFDDFSVKMGDMDKLAEDKFLQKKQIVVIIPAFNEERFIGSVVLSTLPYADYVIVIDDGSSDKTALIAERAGAIVVRQFTNRGKAEALNVGFKTALSMDADVIVCIDGDAQHDSSEIPVVAEPIILGEADVVIGSRFLKVESEIPGWRKIGQHTLTAVTNISSGFKITDSQSGFRAFSADAASKLKFNSGGLSVESEMQFLFQKIKARVAEAPISVKYLDGNKRNPVFHGIQVLESIFSLATRGRPLIFFTLPGFIFLLISIILTVNAALAFSDSKRVMIGHLVFSAAFGVVGMLQVVAGLLFQVINYNNEKTRGIFEEILERMPSVMREFK